MLSTEHFELSSSIFQNTTKQIKVNVNTKINKTASRLAYCAKHWRDLVLNGLGVLVLLKVVGQKHKAIYVSWI